VQCVQDLGGTVVGVGSLIDRSDGAATFGVKRSALATISATTWPPEACPLCASGSQAIKPGSRT
jgi:orotate phosphoribosyltransferase